MNIFETIVKNIVKENEINQNYTHFAIDKITNKILTGWDYTDIDNQSIMEYSKIDLTDQFPDKKPSEIKVVSKNKLQIDPMDVNNWL